MHVLNKTRRGGGLFTPDEYLDVEHFFAARHDIAPTPLVRLPLVAQRLGIGELWVKDEGSRCGIGAFKILGVSYAISKLLARVGDRRDMILACATAGNHGRAVARVAREFGLRSEVYMPCDAPLPHRAAIAAEGAHVTVCSEHYDGTVEQLARDARERGWTIISDTSWDGYQEVPRWIMAGYTHLFAEAERQWQPAVQPDVMFAQAGVGGLACALGSWTDARQSDRRSFIVCCEPTGAACILESARAGHAVSLSGPLRTMMNGLRCAVPSPLAWDAIARTFDAFVAVTDVESAEAMRMLAPKVVAGPSGACGLAALSAVMSNPDLREVREAAKLGPKSTVLVVNTEGATDPELYRRIVS